MKVLFVTYCRAVFGANLALLSLICDLRDRYNIEPQVLIPAVEDGDFHKELEKLQIPYYVHKMKSWVVSENKKLKWARGYKVFLHNKREIKKWKELLETEKFDFIYSNNSTIQYGADLAEELKLPHIWHIREFLKEDYRITFNYPLCFVKMKFRKSKKVITVSNALKEYFEQNFYKGKNMIAVYDGLIIQKKLKCDWNYNRTLEICNVGVLQEGKNQMELLQAASFLAGQGITNFHITFIGSGEEYENKMKIFCKDKNIENYVTFMGYQPNVNEILDKMDVGVICSKSEAFGRVTVEYMMSSLPAIGAKGAGTSEIIEHGTSGYLYSSGNVEELASYIERFIHDRKDLVKFGTNAYRYANEKFILEKNTDAVYRIINENKKE